MPHRTWKTIDMPFGDKELRQMSDISPFEKLTTFLDRLSASSIYFQLKYSREESIMVFIDVPGEKWEVEFFVNGETEIERFRSDGSIEGENLLEELFAKFSD